MIVKWVKGDLIEMAKEGRFSAIGHGCNCFHTMGSGIAPLMNNFTEGRLLEADKKTSCGDINKLGTVSWTDVDVNERSVRVFNLYTQFNFGTSDNVYVHWKSFENALYEMVNKTAGTDIAIPLIGCGLAGGKIGDFKAAVRQVAWAQGSHKVLHVVEYDQG